MREGRAVGEADPGPVLKYQTGRHQQQQQPHQDLRSAVQCGFPKRLVTGTLFQRHEHQQKIAAEIADAQCRQIDQRQQESRIDRNHVPRPERRVERRPNTRAQQGPVRQMKNSRGQRDAHRAGIAKMRCPLDAHQQERQQRRQRQQQQDVPRRAVDKDGEHVLLGLEVHLPRLPEGAALVIRIDVNQRQQKVEQQADEAAQNQPAQKPQVEETDPANPDQRPGEHRQQPDHHPVLRDRRAVGQRRPVQPRVPFAEAEFQHTAEDVGEQQQVEQLLHAGRGPFPDGQLQAEHRRRQHRRQPRSGNGQQGKLPLFAEALVVRPVMRQQDDGTRQQPERQRPAEGGKKVQHERHPVGGNPIQRIRGQVIQRRVEFRARLVLGDARRLGDVVHREPVVEGGEIEDQSRDGHQPGQIFADEFILLRRFVLCRHSCLLRLSQPLCAGKKLVPFPAQIRHTFHMLRLREHV